ncbi:hypothetical protein Tco_1058035 [Tanacetum coccineum]|uniref:Uncharacterized protein n=1 Tax=Tanacetum coccineum TaxID=301880 RepID=A0ABQ5H981_9ASTR
MGDFGNGYPRKGQNRSQNDKTEHENGKSVKEKSNQSQKSKKSKSTKVNPDKVKVKGGADIEEMLNGPTRTHLMGRRRSYNAPVALALMATSSIDSSNSKNEYAWGDKYEQMEYDLKIRDLKLEEKQKELDQVLKERDDFKVKLEKWTNASVLQNEVLNKQRYVSDKSCIGFGIESSSGMESDNSSGDETLTDHLAIRRGSHRQRILKKCLCSKQEIVFQDTQTDCIQDTAQKMKLKRLKASIATMSRQTDAEQRRPTIKKLEVRASGIQVRVDCWEKYKFGKSKYLVSTFKVLALHIMEINVLASIFKEIFKR